MSDPAQATASSLKAIIVDDEPAARRGVKLLLADHPDVEIVGEAGQCEEAVGLIGRTKPDLIFLDVQMPQGDGFDLISRVGVANLPAVVFVTAYDDYALRAFEVNAIDYLLKPYEDGRFHAAVDRARQAIRQRRVDSVNSRLTKLLSFLEKQPPEATGVSPDALADRILVKTAGEIIFLKADEIDWIEAEGDYMVFHVAGKKHLLRETMARLEARLDAKRFIRIHRSTIVNIDRVRKLSPSFVGEYAVVLQDGTKLKLSRTYQERLQDMLKGTL